MTTELQPSKPNKIATHNATEKYILDIFYDQEFQSRIKDHLKETVKQELQAISPFLKESIQGWLARERNKMKQGGSDEKTIQLTTQVESLESETRDLKMEQAGLLRKIELKGHENKMLFDSLQETFKRK